MSRVISYNINPNLNVQAGVHKTYFIIRGRNLRKELEEEQKKKEEEAEGEGDEGDEDEGDEDEGEGEEEEEEEAKEDELLMQDYDKNGFYYKEETKTFMYYYPQEFVAPAETGSDKYIVFQYCHAILDGGLSAEIEIHSDFIPRDTYCDSLIYYCNLQPPDDNRKYCVNTNKQMGFSIWFTDSTGLNKIVPYNFVVFFKLYY